MTRKNLPVVNIVPYLLYNWFPSLLFTQAGQKRRLTVKISINILLVIYASQVTLKTIPKQPTEKLFYVLLKKLFWQLLNKPVYKLAAVSEDTSLAASGRGEQQSSPALPSHSQILQFRFKYFPSPSYTRSSTQVISNDCHLVPRNYFFYQQG